MFYTLQMRSADEGITVKYQKVLTSQEQPYSSNVNDVGTFSEY
jgi:hypothetical protein